MTLLQYAQAGRMPELVLHHADLSPRAHKVCVVLGIPDSEVRPVMRAMPKEADVKGNFILEANWRIPSMVTNHIQVPNGSGGAVFKSFGTHMLTPETENTAHSLYALTRRHLLDAPSMSNAPLPTDGGNVGARRILKERIAVEAG